LHLGDVLHLPTADCLLGTVRRTTPDAPAAIALEPARLSRVTKSLYEHKSENKRRSFAEAGVFLPVFFPLFLFAPLDKPRRPGYYCLLLQGIQH